MNLKDFSDAGICFGGRKDSGRGWGALRASVYVLSYLYEKLEIAPPLSLTPLTLINTNAQHVYCLFV